MLMAMGPVEGVESKTPLLVGVVPSRRMIAFWLVWGARGRRAGLSTYDGLQVMALLAGVGRARFTN